jgi:hypothetical protein
LVTKGLSFLLKFQGYQKKAICCREGRYGII